MKETRQIKENLISKIKDSNDFDFLKALQTIINASQNEVYQLTKEQEKSIAIGRKQIENGEKHDNETVMNEAKEWLRKK